MLKFIGSGSAFNTKLGNNSAYYKEGNQLLLIDCGSNIFQRIKEGDLLDGVEHIHVLITHTHADHIGSLADLILYSYYSHGEMMKIKTSVYSIGATNTVQVLKLMGVTEEHYEYNPVRHTIETKLKQFDDLVIKNVYKNEHVNELSSFGYLLSINGRTVYYSGDASNFNEEILKLLEGNKVDYAYIDTCKADYEGNVHLSLRELSEVVKPNFRKYIWCMHLDENFIHYDAEKLGFNVVKNEF